MTDYLTSLPMPHPIMLDAEKVRFMTRFVSTEQMRPHLQGVLIEPLADGRSRMVATDGHRLGVMVDATPQRDGPLAWRMIVDFGKVPPIRERWGELLRLECDGRYEIGALKDDGAGGEFVGAGKLGRARIIYGTYPDWERVVPQIAHDGRFGAVDGASFEAGYNARYLADFAWRKNDAAIAIRNGKPGDPALIMNACRDFWGVLMPVRTSWPFARADYVAPKAPQSSTAAA